MPETARELDRLELRDGERWLREGATEIEKAHRVLDDWGAPRDTPDGVERTLASRIEAFLRGR